jgi:hypothetical protein
MNIPHGISDDDVLRTAAGLLSVLPVADPPDAAGIMARGRARRQRRLTGLGVAGAAGVTALALVLAGVLGGASSARPAGTIRTAAFTLVKNANGTATLKLRQRQVFNPAVLQRALARDGIPALVKTNMYCRSQPAPPVSAVSAVVSVQLPNGTPVAGPGQKVPVPAHAVTVIKPAAMPAGTKLFFDYVNNDRDLIGGLIYTNSYTCASGLPHGISAP